MVTTAQGAYMWLREYLKEGGVEAAPFEASILLHSLAGITAQERLSNPSLSIDEGDMERLLEGARERVSGRPLQYIVGEWSFMGLDFIVTPDVLIPRPDTETLVEGATALLQNTISPRILDLCTGSGCIGISLCARLPQARALLCDLSQGALEVARRNVIKHNLSKRVGTIRLDVTAAAPSHLGTFDCIVSNPPYLNAADMKKLPREVGFEPEMALYGGGDGLVFYREIVKNYTPRLKPGAFMAFEVGINQSGAVLALMEEAGLREGHTLLDLGGIERVVYAKRPL